MACSSQDTPLSGANEPASTTAEQLNIDTSSQVSFGAKFVLKSSDLPSCDSSRIGQLFYVVETKEFIGCYASGYESITISGQQGETGQTGPDGVQGLQGPQGSPGAKGADGNDGTSCNGYAIAEGVEIVCDSITIDTIMHGSVGTQENPGTAGQRGLNGNSCTISDTFPSGYTLACEDGTSVMITNGEDGDKGAPGTPGSSCISINNNNGTYTISCEDGSAVTLSDGALGIAGKDGTDGSSCSTINNPDGSYTVSCEDGTNVQITNGADGSVGAQGTNGTNCVTSENPAGDSLIVTCNNQTVGWPKAMCGDSPYAPEGSLFCYNLQLHTRCNGAIFVPTEQFCYNDQLFDLCGDQSFDPTIQFCADTTLFNLCDGSPYSPDSEFCDARDGQTYRYVLYSDLKWMAENLNYSGDDNNGTKTFVYGYCFDQPDHTDAAHCDTYGRLYDWSELMDIGAQYNTQEWGGTDENHQGLCPNGWRIPTQSEYREIDMFNTGTDLKSTSGWRSNGNGNDSFSFTILPSGIRNGNGTYTYLTERSYLWTATEHNYYQASIRLITYSSILFLPTEYPKTGGRSARCVQPE